MNVIHRTGKKGLASAYRQAFNSLLDSSADVIAQMDCDFSHDPAVLVEMAKRIESCDLVLGSRYIPGGSTDLRWPFWRKALSAGGNYYARTILGMSIRDMTGGYRMWRREMLRSMPLERVKSNGYVFQVEMAYLADCLRAKFAKSRFILPTGAGQVEDVIQNPGGSGCAGLVRSVELSRSESKETEQALPPTPPKMTIHISGGRIVRKRLC